jgi:hypothetical protein
MEKDYRYPRFQKPIQSAKRQMELLIYLSSRSNRTPAKSINYDMADDTAFTVSHLHFPSIYIAIIYIFHE